MTPTFFSPSTPPGPLTVYRRAAMASDFEVSLNATRGDVGADVAFDALDEIDRIEDVLSIFRPTTPISRINLLASEMNIRVDDELWNLLQTSLRLGEATGGAFDVAAAPLWRAWGFAKRDGRFPEPDVLKRALEKSGARHLRLDEAARTVAFDEEGVELNFGAIGKGFALDSAARILEDGGLRDFLVQGGGSGAVARGARANDVWRDESARPIVADSDAAPEFDEESGRPLPKKTSDAEALDALLPAFLKRDPAFASSTASGGVGTDSARRLAGWTIGVSHPLFPERRVAELLLRDRALATSGSTRQFFRSGGKRYSHVIDPRTGYPAFGVLSATVLAPTAAEADALSTAFFVVGETETAAFCARRTDVAALLILERETHPGYELKTFNLGGDVFRRVDGAAIGDTTCAKK